jgi:hypothetical protein
LVLTTTVPECRIIYDEFHILQRASQAVDEVRRPEFFRKGGAARDLVRGKRWLLLTSWLNLDRGKRRQLNPLCSEPAHSQSLPGALERLKLSQSEGSKTIGQCIGDTFVSVGKVSFLHRSTFRTSCVKSHMPPA